MRTTVYTALIAFLAAGAASANTISLTGGADLVDFSGNQILMGETGCAGGTCTYTGSQSLGSGILTWQFQTPNTTANVTFDFGGNVYGPTGGAFSASDGSDSFLGSYTFSTWDFDGIAGGGGFYGIDLYGSISITGTTLNGVSDPNEPAFETLFSLPAASSYNFVLDVGSCQVDSTYVPCLTPDPPASFIALGLTPQFATPEPGTIGMMACGLLLAFAARRRASR